MATTGVRLWTVDEYHRMIEVKILNTEDPVELLEGQIIEMSPQQPPHAAITQWSFNYLTRLLAGKAFLRMQLPVTLPPNSEPEPDIAVVRVDARGYISRHPLRDDIFLLIEVADATVNQDRKQKARIYAEAKIADYWVVDVNQRQVYVLREPTDKGYGTEMVLDENGVLRLVAFPDVEVEVKLLFP